MILMKYLKGEDAEKQQEMVNDIKKITKKHLVVIKTKDDKTLLVSDNDPIKEDLEESIEMLEDAIAICKSNLEELDKMKVN
jgi:hypothetical protein